MYYVIHNSDGYTTVTLLNKDELIERVNDNYWGSDVEYLDSIPRETDINYWGEGKVLIIKGDVSVPKPKKVIETFEID